MGTSKSKRRMRTKRRERERRERESRERDRGERENFAMSLLEETWRAGEQAEAEAGNAPGNELLGAHVHLFSARDGRWNLGHVIGFSKR